MRRVSVAWFRSRVKMFSTRMTTPSKCIHLAVVALTVLYLVHWCTHMVGYSIEESDQAKIRSSFNLTATQAVLSASSRDLVDFTAMELLPGIKNPCFYTNTSGGRRMSCLPYFFLVGFPKCGTTDFWDRLTRHKYVASSKSKEPHWFEEQPGYVKTPKTKRLSHYIDEFQLTADIISGTVSKKPKRESQLVHRAGNIKYEHKEQPHTAHFSYSSIDREKVITGDFTPGYSWCNNEWNTDPHNAHLSEPRILVPHRIKAILPSARFIFLLRNPVDRLLSDYNFHKHGEKTASDFHEQVTKAIQWWDTCLASLSERRCLYGLDYPDHLLPIGASPCQNLQRKDLLKRCTVKTSDAWSINAASQLRRGLYHLYIQDWLKVFPRKNMMFIHFEDYSKRPLHVLETEVLPFLGLEPFDNTTRDFLLQLEKQTKHATGSKVKMLPDTRILLETFYSSHMKGLLNILL